MYGVKQAEPWILPKLTSVKGYFFSVRNRVYGANDIMLKYAWYNLILFAKLLSIKL